jgi:hypothetical protein
MRFIGTGFVPLSQVTQMTQMTQWTAPLYLRVQCSFPAYPSAETTSTAVP